ncbi:MAG: hypothetical protein AAFQ88_00140 [Pseudomonadota bacterium]
MIVAKANQNPLQRPSKRTEAQYRDGAGAIAESAAPLTWQGLSCARIAGCSGPRQDTGLLVRQRERRKRFVHRCRNVNIQELTFDALRHKELVKGRPLAHLRIFARNLAHLTGLAQVPS